MIKKIHSIGHLIASILVIIGLIFTRQTKLSADVQIAVALLGTFVLAGLIAKAFGFPRDTDYTGTAEEREKKDMKDSKDQKPPGVMPEALMSLMKNDENVMAFVESIRKNDASNVAGSTDEAEVTGEVHNNG